MKTKFTGMLERAKGRDAFWVERAILEVTEEIVALMNQRGVSKSELAKRLGKNPSFVTKLLSGNNNFTLETLVRIGRRLACEYRSHFQPDGTTCQWINFVNVAPELCVVQPPQPSQSGEWNKEAYTTVIEFDANYRQNESLASVA